MKQQLRNVWIFLVISFSLLICTYYGGQHSVTAPLPFNKDIPLIRYFDKRGFGIPKELLPNKTDLWTRNVQLCIMFNSVHSTKTIGLLLSYYLQFFNHITLLVSGTKHATKPQVIPDSVQVLTCNSYYGWYQQKCLSLCLQNPASLNVEGFLYIADDMFVNLTKMNQLNRTKIWYLNTIRRYNYTELQQMNFFQLHKMWYWFGPPNNNVARLKDVIDALPTEWLTLLRKNAGFPGNLEMRSISDIVYVPWLLASLTDKVLEFITNTTSLFCEIAVPVAVGIVSHPSQRETLSYGYLWKERRHSLAAKQKIANDRHFVHPIKLGNAQDAQLWEELMKIQLQQAVYVNQV